MSCCGSRAPRPLRDLFEEADRKEVPQAVDAGIIRRVAETAHGTGRGLPRRSRQKASKTAPRRTGRRCRRPARAVRSGVDQRVVRWAAASSVDEHLFPPFPTSKDRQESNSMSPQVTFQEQRRQGPPGGGRRPGGGPSRALRGCLTQCVPMRVPAMGAPPSSMPQAPRRDWRTWDPAAALPGGRARSGESGCRGCRANDLSPPRRMAEP